MTKLNGTSAHLFAGLAESLKTRGASRFDKTAGAKTPDKAFRDLLHTVSNAAPKTLVDQAADGPKKADALRPRLARFAERDELKDETVDERTETTEEPGPSNKPASLDPAPKVENVQSRLSLPNTAGQELVAAQVVEPQMQAQTQEQVQAAPRPQLPADDKKNVPVRSAAGQESPAASLAKTLAADTPKPAARVEGAATAPQATASMPGAVPATSGFEAVTANIEQAAKVMTREALPEVTKVTVLQQETHLPPVAQFTAPQQVAHAVVAELDGTAAPAPAAASTAPSQGNAPDQPLKLLTISLEPPALGNVTVRLRLVGTEVSVHLAADRKDTSQMLDQQRDSIRELMQTAGYVADVAPVQHGSLDGFQAGAGGQSQSSLAGQQQAPSGQGASDNSNQSSGQPQGGARQARDERQSHQEARREQDVVPQTRRGPVYL